MNSRLILSTAGLVLFLSGAALSFLPQETAAALGLAPAVALVLVMQVFSAALLGLGILNWFSRANLIGGIYSRPLALANFLFFGVSAVSLDRVAVNHGVPQVILIAAIVASLFAIAFFWLLFIHDPIGKKPAATQDPK